VKRNQAKQVAAKPKRTRRIWGSLSRRFLSVGFLRRWYIRRTLRYIDKYRDKGRPLPEGMEDLARYLARVPKYERAKKFEEAITTNQELENPQDLGRQMRRATARQRKSGKGGGYRPGLPPGTIKQAGRGRPR
jgi:hypothetical protein